MKRRKEEIKDRAKVLAATNSGMRGRERSILALMKEFGLNDYSALGYLLDARRRVEGAKDSKG
jgi:hypothetical protein